MKKITTITFLLISLKSFSAQRIEDQKQFEEVIKRFTKIWSSKVESDYGKKLIVEHDWNNTRVNASATRDRDYNFVIKVSGAMAKQKGMDEDALLFILCHELGHHLGGAPKKKRGESDIDSWSSAEGQADYFAAKECLPIVYDEDGDDKKNVDDKVIEQLCEEELCERILETGLKVSMVFAEIKHSEFPSLLKTSNIQVSQTNLSHPDVQCRLDTIKNGALGNERPECWFRD